VRVVAYNIRMGFGLDGRFDLAGLTAAIAAQRPDVVLLSEVDRAWLLNGGHDTLALLADRLAMPYRFAPAADAVWGDAVLTRLPVVYTATVRLRAVGAPTGAQALGVVLDADGAEVAVVSTHLQPPPDGGPVSQAREVAAFARGFAAGRPLVVGGDLNTQPGDAAFAAFTDAGLLDGFATDRPLPTSPANAPQEQIDHLLVSPEISVTEVVAPRTEASDHLPVAATLTVS
jgi:endonuclease/exonuclease/phosphatase family metal-dependent hydrolase